MIMQFNKLIHHYSLSIINNILPNVTADLWDNLVEGSRILKFIGLYWQASYSMFFFIFDGENRLLYKVYEVYLLSNQKNPS